MQTVYLGPAVQAKDYFESLGYVFPAEVNPADYLLDIIGGEVACPGGNPALRSHEDLPALWKENTTFNTHSVAAAAAAGRSSESSVDSTLSDPKLRKVLY
eukprot:COSAG01_NODE_3852_length_5629_cov_3.080108_7_plen_100_part_00